MGTDRAEDDEEVEGDLWHLFLDSQIDWIKELERADMVVDGTNVVDVTEWGAASGVDSWEERKETEALAIVRWDDVTETVDLETVMVDEEKLWDNSLERDGTLGRPKESQHFGLLLHLTFRTNGTRGSSLYPPGGGSTS